MAFAGLKEQLVKQIDEAYSLERAALRSLERLIETTEDSGLKEELRRHKPETERHAERMQQRLEAHNQRPSALKEIAGIAGALVRSAVGRARGGEDGRNAREAYANAKLEIATYELLERLAQRAGDEETAALARENRTAEEQLATRLEASFEALAERSLG